MKPDLADGLTFAGLLLMGAGLWLIEPAYALTVVGAVLTWLGIRSAGGRT